MKNPQTSQNTTQFSIQSPCGGMAQEHGSLHPSLEMSRMRLCLLKCGDLNTVFIFLSFHALQDSLVSHDHQNSCRYVLYSSASDNIHYNCKRDFVLSELDNFKTVKL